MGKKIYQGIGQLKTDTIKPLDRGCLLEIFALLHSRIEGTDFSGCMKFTTATDINLTPLWQFVKPSALVKIYGLDKESQVVNVFLKEGQA